MITLLEIFIFLVALYIFSQWRRPKGHPPGPFRWPLVGNIPQIAMTHPYPAEALRILSKKHGDIFSIKTGQLSSVVVTSFESIRDLWSRDDMTGRRTPEVFEARNMGLNAGILVSNGDVWTQLRRFAIRTMRDFGFGRRASMEKFIFEELDDVIKHMKLDSAKNNGVIRMHGYFTLSFLNVLWSLMTGLRLPYDDPKLNLLADNTEEFAKASNFVVDTIMSFPFLKNIVPGYLGVERDRQIHQQIQNIIREMLNDSRFKMDQGTEPYTFVDKFVQLIMENPQSHVYNDDQFVVTAMDIFQAGSDTLNNVLSFAVLFFMLHPQVQDNIRTEITDVIGSHQTSLDHKNKMPYTEATIFEVLRLGNIIPVYHRETIADVHYKEFVIPKGTNVIWNLHAVYNDPEFWGDPSNFCPERFLTSDGLQLDKSKTERNLSFGLGKRNCIGQVMGEASLFLYIVTMLKHFKFSVVPGESEPSTVPALGLTVSPQPFNVLVTPILG